MAAVRELNIKPSCAHEIHAFPSKRTDSLWEKIHQLVEDPLPDGKVKKKIQGAEGLYRARLGAYRLFYTFGPTWIRLLGIRKRDEKTYDNLDAVDPDEPSSVSTAGDDIDIDALEERPNLPKVAVVEAKPSAKAKKLPKRFSPAWLAELKVPDEHISTLAVCTTEDDLLAANVPEWVLNRVLDNLFPRPLDEVAQQPDLVVNSTEDLVKFKEGTLLSFLLKLDPDQEKLTTWALNGPTLVKGGAGTGKSTVALYRVRSLLRRPGATGSEKVLFTTYTRALESVSQQLLEPLLTPEEMKRVRVATCDVMVQDVLRKVRKIGGIEPKPLSVLEKVRETFVPSAPNGFEQKLRSRSLAKIDTKYLLEEIEWIIEGRSLKTVEEYEASPRPGRGIPLGSKMRASVWQLYRAYAEALQQLQRETFVGLRTEACGVACAEGFVPPYDYVLVDEAQDLAPTTLRFLAHLARTPEGIFFAADSKQSIYSRGAGWTAVDPRLQFKGRTSNLSRNYRSTAEIEAAAFSLLKVEPGEDPPETSICSNTGPLPVLLRGATSATEPRWIASFLRQMAKQLGVHTYAAAVLVPDKVVGDSLASGLAAQGVAARFFESKTLDLKTPEVKVVTFHSAKGLEFPTVVVAGLHDRSYPTPGAGTEGDADPYPEAMRHYRRLLYVACTRAMRGLMVVERQGCSDQVLTQLQAGRWSIQEVK